MVSNLQLNGSALSEAFSKFLDVNTSDAYLV